MRMPGERLLAPCGVTLVVLLTACSGSGCSSATDGSSRVSAVHSPSKPGKSRTVPRSRVGNFDPRGADAQPDYDGEAWRLRERVRRKLPEDRPADARVACQHMFRAVDEFYAAIEPDAQQRERILQDLQATRAQDVTSCMQHTSSDAAACVVVLLDEGRSEFPWILDQCSRAFPVPDAGA